MTDIEHVRALHAALRIKEAITHGMPYSGLKDEARTDCDSLITMLSDARLPEPTGRPSDASPEAWEEAVRRVFMAASGDPSLQPIPVRWLECMRDMLLAKPVAYAVMSEDGNIIIWSTYNEHVQKAAERYGRPILPLRA